MSDAPIILCPIDFSRTSEHAVEYALGLAKTLGAAVHVVHVYHLPVYALPQAAPLPTPELTAEIDGALKKSLTELVDRIGQSGVPVEGHLVQGVPHERIVELAEKLGAEMIIMGTHGRTGLVHALVGSVAERVVRTASMPVTTVRLPE